MKSGNEIDQHQNYALGKLLSHIIVKYLHQFYTICVLWHGKSAFEDTMSVFLNNSSRVMSHHNFTMPNFHLINMLEECKPDRCDADRAVERAINMGCQAFIVSAEAAMPFLNSFGTVVFTCRQRFYKYHFVFVPTMNEGVSDVNQEMLDILKHRSISDVPNVLIIMPNRNSFDLITSQFVGRVNNSSPVLLDTFYCSNATFERNNNLFPDKLCNLHQRSVRLALFNYKPYTIWKEVPVGLGNANAENSSDEKTLNVDGTEMIMMLSFCAEHNCTVEVVRQDLEEWGEIWDNRSGLGVLGAVVERRADVGMSALLLWHQNYKFVEFSMPITRIGITVAVPRQRMISGWFLPVWPFSWSMWTAVSLTFVVLVLGVFVRRSFCTKRNEASRKWNDPNFVCVSVSGIFLYQSIPIVKVSKSTDMMMLGCIFVLGFMIGSCYSGVLSSLMTVPQYETPIDTPQQLANSNMEWGALTDSWIYSILLGAEPHELKLVNHFKILKLEELIARAKIRNFSLPVERMQFGSLATQQFITEDNVDSLQPMREDIYHQYTIAMTTKTWPLKEHFDKMILKYVQSGMLQYLEHQMVFRYSNNKVQYSLAHSRPQPHENAEPKILTISHLAGVFMVWFIGLTVSSVAFACERYLRVGK